MDIMNTDGLYHVSLLGGQARALLINCTGMTETARRIHSLSRVCTAALGRTLAATGIMAAMLKGERESVSVTIKGGGPIGSIVTVGHGDGTVKGYVDFPDVELPRAGKKLPVGAAVGKEGKLTVVKDLGLKDPYVGQVNLVSGEIAEDFAMYFTASEQVPSLVSLGVLVGDNVVSAGGLIVQMLPGASESAISAIEKSAPLFSDISLTLKDMSLREAVDFLLGHLEPKILGESAPRWKCDCSRSKIERVLITLGRDELTDIINTQHGAQIDCHFCEKRYEFSEDELKELLKNATSEVK